jgi:lysophospholipase L1-like esterase
VPDRSWDSFVALGDSFTEGLDDPSGDGGYRGWADRVAESLADQQPGFRYANLAVRGRLLGDVVRDQVPAAVEMRPALVSLFGGVNDILRPRVDLALLGLQLEDAVRRLRESGAEVLLFVGVDPSRRSRLMQRLMPRIHALNEIVETTASVYGCRVASLWQAEVFDDERLWSPDRLHLSSEGHRRVAGAVLESLGYGDDSWREPLPVTGANGPPSRTQALREDARWVRQHFGPWLARRVQGKSSGDGISAKRPDLTPL